VIEFESVEKAMAVHDSPGYQAALKALGDGAVRDLRIVAGVEWTLTPAPSPGPPRKW